MSAGHKEHKLKLEKKFFKWTLKNKNVQHKIHMHFYIKKWTLAVYAFSLNHDKYGNFWQ